MNRFLLLSISCLLLSMPLSAQLADDCASAVTVAAAAIDCANTGSNITGTTVGANTDGFNFSCIDANANPGVWMRFVAQGPDIEILNNGGVSPFVAIIEDNCTGPAIELICQQLPILEANGGDGDDLLTTGTTYLMWIGFDGTQNPIDICVTNGAAPANDDCAGVIDISGSLNCVTGGGSTVTGSTTNAGPDGLNFPCLAAGTNGESGVWYSFNAAGVDLVVDDVLGNSPYVIVTDACAGAGGVLYCGTAPIDLTNGGDNILTVGDQYYLFVGFDNQDEQDFEICVDNPTQPTNDDCSAAMDISGSIDCATSGANITGDLYGADVEGFGFGCLPNSQNYEGVWYTFNAQGNDLNITSSGDIDPYVIITDGCDPNTGTLYYCGQAPIEGGTVNDATGLATNNAFIPDLLGNQFYMWVGTADGIEGAFDICVDNPPPPPNDLCSEAIELSMAQIDCSNSGMTVVGNTTNATNFFLSNGAILEPFPAALPNCFNNNEDEVVWYRFEAQGPDISITEQAGRPLSFALLTDWDCNSGGTPVACGDLPYDFLVDPDDLLETGTEYYLMIGYKGGWTASDTFEICIDNPEAPMNDLCDDAERVDQDRLLGCGNGGTSITGTTINSSQDGLFWTNIDPLVDLDCALDTLEDDGVWYVFEAIGVHLEVTDVMGNDPTILLINYNNCVDTVISVLCEPASAISGNINEPGFLSTQIGGTYLMYVSFQGGEANNDDFELCIRNYGMCTGDQPPEYWCDATIDNGFLFCELFDLDGFCFTNRVNSVPPENWPGCTNTLHSPNWFTFYAGAENLQLLINVGACLGSNGIQIAMYELDCSFNIGSGEPCPASDLASLVVACNTGQNATGTVVDFSAALELGNYYGIVVDGWADAECQLFIDVSQGGEPASFDSVSLEEPMFTNIDELGEDTLCVGSIVEFTLDQDVPGACRYDWTVDDQSVPNSSNELTEIIEFPDPGQFELCVTAGNICASSDPTCITLTVIELVPETLRDTICEGDDYEWIGPYGNVLDLGLDPTMLEGGLHQFDALTSLDPPGCEVMTFLELEVLDENDENPTVIDTVLCSGDIPFVIFDSEPIDPISGLPSTTPGGQNNIVTDVPREAQIAFGGACDSHFIVTVVELQVVNRPIILPAMGDAPPRPPLEEDSVTCIDGEIVICPGIPAVISPDPIFTAEMNVQHIWINAFTQDTLSTERCITLKREDFQPNPINARFEYYIILDYDGRPSGGCTFGPYDLDLDLREFMPDSVQILGPDTVCIGPDYLYTLELSNPNVSEFQDADSYSWDLSGMPGATRTEISQDSSLITFSTIGAGRICVTAEHFCINSATVCKDIVVPPEPTVDAGDDTEECSDVHQLSATPTSGHWTVVNVPAGSSSVVFADSTDANTTVTVSGKGIYTFSWVVDWFECIVTNEINVDFVQAIDLVGAIEYECGPVAETYTGSFTFTGGVEPFTLTMGSGTLDAGTSTFTSDPIAIGDSMVVVITDADGCTAQFTLSHDCPCLTEGGVMAVNDPQTLCGETCIDAVPLMDPVPDGNDIIRYVLHTGSMDVLGTVIEENENGTFCLTSGGAIQYDVQYYVSVVVGNALGNSVDTSDRCAQIAAGQPVIWRVQPDPSSAGDIATCGQSVTLNVLDNVFGGEWIIISQELNITFDDQTSPNATINSGGGAGVVVLGWVESNGDCVDTAVTMVEFFQNPTAGAPTPGCNDDQSELSFTIVLSGQGPFTEATNAGTFTNNEYLVEGLPNPYNGGDVLTFVDANGCEVEVTLPQADCNCIPIVPPDTACGLSITLTSSGTGNSGFWSEGTHPTGTGTVSISDPNSRTTTITVTDFGEYCFNWTEEGTLCTLSTPVCIPFVDAPVVDAASVMFSCDENYDNYTVTFDIVDGHQPSYQVTDELGNSVGSIVGSTFTSNFFPSTQNVVFLVFDGFNCDTFRLDTLHDCGCFTEVGNLSMDSLYLCLDETTTVDYDASVEMRDGNDILGYILYTDPADPLGSIIAQSTDGVFAYDAGSMSPGTVYYVAAVLGDGVSGVLDLTDNCLSISMEMPVQWFEDPTFTLSSSLPEFTCTDTMMTLSVTGAGIPGEYNVTWTTNDGRIRTGDENSTTPTILDPGTYTVTAAHNLAGCDMTESITIGESDDIPTITIATPDILTCDRTEVVVSAMGSASGPNITYAWSGPGVVGANDGITVTVDQPGTYTLVLTDTDNGCVTDRQVIVTEDVVDPAAAASTNQLFDCNTDQLILSGLGSAEGANIQYAWTALDGGNIVGSNTTRDITVDIAGTYQIEVTNTDNGCVSTATVVAENDPTVIADIELTAVQVSCDGDGDDGQLTVTQVIGGTTPFMYSFDGGISFQDANSVSELTAGTYPIVVMDDNGCTHEDTVVLVQPEDFTLELGETIVIEFGDSAHVNAITDLPADQIQSIIWSPIYDSTGANTLSQSFLPDLGQYPVNLTVNSINGCTQSDFVLVVVKFGERLYIPTAMRPTSSNPDNQVINIYADPTSVAEIPYFAIYDRWGERVFERTDIPPSLELQPEYTWDGIWQDELAHSGVYAYYVEVEFITGVRRTITGSFTLLR